MRDWPRAFEAADLSVLVLTLPHRLLDMIVRASETGMKQVVGN